LPLALGTHPLEATYFRPDASSEAADHRALWIRERIDHGEMVHPGDGLVTGLRTGNRRKRTRAARCEEVDPTLMT
jgi:hypothetical protein